MAKYSAAESVLKEAFPDIKVENKTLQGAAFLIGDEKNNVRIYVGVGKDKSDENFEIDRAIITYKIPEEITQMVGMPKAIENVSKKHDISFNQHIFDKGKYNIQKDMTKPSLDNIVNATFAIEQIRRNINSYFNSQSEWITSRTIF